MLPNSLKHYTSIDTLDKILESKKIRFSRFDNMDDQTETEGLPELLQKKYFLSCWIDENRENIPQWKMYAEKGVRIELIRKWYTRHPIPILGRNGEILTSPYLEPVDEEKNIFFILPFYEHLRYNQKQNYHIAPPLNEENGIIVKVEYCDSFLERKQMYLNENIEKTIVELAALFYPIKFKDTYWSFQNEYRYYLVVAPYGKDEVLLPEYIDVPISNKALNQIKVVLYPHCSEKDEKMVEDIFSKHLPELNFKKHIQRSELDDKLRKK